MSIRNPLVLALALTLAACATATPYQPAVKGLGYSEQKIESNRYKVSFVGNSATPREAVDNYLMYRAAEVTLSNGYDYFVVADRTTDVNAERSGGNSSVGIGLGSGGYGSGISLGIGTVLGGGNKDAFIAQADILVFKGAKPAGDSKAFDAREVKANLDPAIRRP